MKGRGRGITGLALVAAGVALAAVLRPRRPRWSFAGRSVVITGGSRGLGLVLARQLAAEGAHLTLIARDETELARAAADIGARHPSAQVGTVVADVTRQEDAERAVSAAVARYGRLDMLINNAGIIQVGPIGHMKISDFDDALKTHFWGPLFFVLAALPHMRRQEGGGRVINIASIGGRVAVPHLAPYSASKFALVGLSDALRAELARENILVTTVCPGLMRTGSPLNASFKGQHAYEYSWFAIASSLPVMTVSAEKAAHQIIEAARRGDAELVVALHAKLAVAARTLAPALVSEAMAVVNRALPRAGDRGGDIARPGRVAGPGWAPSVLLTPLHAAAAENNEL